MSYGGPETCSTSIPKTLFYITKTRNKTPQKHVMIYANYSVFLRYFDLCFRGYSYMINADLRHNRLISLNEFERLIASDFSAHENFFYKHSRGKLSKHYTSRVLYISFYTPISPISGTKTPKLFHDFIHYLTI